MSVRFLCSPYMMVGVLLAWMQSAVLADSSFATESLATRKALESWTLETGTNIQGSFSISEADDGAAVADVVLSKVNPLSGDSGANWYWLLRDVNLDSDWMGAEALVLTLSLSEPSPRYLVAQWITNDGQRYTAQVKPGAEPWASFAPRVIPLSKFKNADNKEAKLDLSQVRALRIGGRGESMDIQFGGVEILFPEESVSGWLKVVPKSSIASPLFEKGEPLRLHMEALEGVPAGVQRVKIVVSNYWKELVFTQEFAAEALAGGVLELPTLSAGYYEVQAYADFGNGWSDSSCVSSSGQLPEGIQTFAVMPSTLEENIMRMEAVGENAFFGIHGVKYTQEIDGLIGVPWSMQYSRWRSEEPTQGQSRLVNEMATVQPAKPWQLAVTSFAENHRKSVPQWWLQDADEKPPIYLDEDYLDYVKQYTRYHMQRFPAMAHRIYDCAWEIDLNRPGWHQPYFTEQEVVDYYRSVGQAIRETDPDAQIIGPCAHTFMGWIETLFEDGLLDVVDAVSTHFYCTPPPESIHSNLLHLKAMIQEYAGESMPIWNTEAGFRSIREDGTVEPEHAAWVVRYNLILKGEGVAKNLTFYTIDFDAGKGTSDSWGLGYNADKSFSYNPKVIAPKPALSAYATCVNQLLGAEPVGNLNWLGSGIWGYLFKQDGTNILALWSPERTREFRLPVGAELASVPVVDMMGRVDSIDAQDGFVTLPIGPEPLYIRELPDALYGEYALGDKVTQVYPGDRVSIALSGIEMQEVSVTPSTPGIEVLSIDDDTVELLIGESIPPGPQALIIMSKVQADDASEQVLWLNVGEALEIKQVSPGMLGNDFGLSVQLIPHGSLNSNNIEVRGRITSGDWHSSTEIDSLSNQITAFVPLPTLGSLGGQAPLSFDAQVEIATPGQNPMSWQGSVYLLAARKTATSPISPLRDTAEIKSHDGMHVGDARFQWDEEALHIQVEVIDDVHRQSYSGVNTWREDSLQLAFDTDPEHQYPYDFMTGNLRKKVSEIAVACGDAGIEVWRHLSYNPDELPLGEVSENAIHVEFQQSGGGEGFSIYQIAIPWSEMGFDELPAAGKMLGVSILINDSDEAGGRKTYELFGGINENKDPARFGRIVLLP